jgi:hypothetical protein
MSTCLNNEQNLAKNYCLEKIANLLERNTCQDLNLLEIKNLIIDRSIGLTGVPGSGKSTVVKSISESLSKKNLVFSIITPSTASFNSFLNDKLYVQKLSRLLRRIDNSDDQKIKLLPLDYYKTSVCNDEKSILHHHVLIFEDASLYTSTDLDDLASRIQIDIQNKFFRPIENTSLLHFPVFLFCGDTKQLIPPLNTLVPDLHNIGYVSEKILKNNEKCFSLEINHRKPVLADLSKTIQSVLDLELIDSKTSKNLLGMIKDKMPQNLVVNFDCAKKLYSNLIDINNKTVWIPIQQNKTIEFDLRNEYINLKKLELKHFDYCGRFIGDYVKSISNINLTLKPLSNISSNLVNNCEYRTRETLNNFVQNGQRFKILNIIETKYAFIDVFKTLFDIQNKYEYIEIFETINFVPVVLFSLCDLNEDKKTFYFIHVPELEIKRGSYNSKNKTLSDFELILYKNTIFKIRDIKYIEFKKIKDMLHSYVFDSNFCSSYVCSPYDLVGQTIDYLFFDFKHKELNYFVLSSLNMLLSRVTNRVYFIIDDLKV